MALGDQTGGCAGPQHERAGCVERLHCKVPLLRVPLPPSALGAALRAGGPPYQVRPPEETGATPSTGAGVEEAAAGMHPHTTLAPAKHR